MDTLKPFNPHGGAAQVVANGVSATPTVLASQLPEWAFYNSSATAIAFIRVTILNLSTDAIAVVSVTKDMPIPPGALIRLSFGRGLKGLSSIASAADGNLYCIPGQGN